MDGVQIMPSDIFSYVDAGGEICTTSSINPQEYVDAFAAYRAAYDAVIVITIGSGFSSCYQNACVAARQFEQVYVVDSANLSSGQGFGEDITEAKCMENYLTAHGISQERLVLEEKSTSTKENLKFSDELTGCSKKNTGILSNNFHVYRAVKLAEKLGYKHPYGIAAVSDPIMQVHYVVRDVASLVKDILRGNI